MQGPRGSAPKYIWGVQDASGTGTGTLHAGQAARELADLPKDSNLCKETTETWKNGRKTNEKRLKILLTMLSWLSSTLDGWSPSLTAIL